MKYHFLTPPLYSGRRSISQSTLPRSILSFSSFLSSTIAPTYRFPSLTTASTPHSYPMDLLATPANGQMLISQMPDLLCEDASLSQILASLNTEAWPSLCSEGFLIWDLQSVHFPFFWPRPQK